MKNKKNYLWIFLVMALLTGCGSTGREFYEQAQDNLELGNDEAAYEAFSQAIDENYQPVKSWEGAGISLLHQGKYKKAISAFEKALEVKRSSDKQKAQINLYLANAEYERGDRGQALTYCETALDLDATAQGYLLRGKIQLDNADYQTAKQSFEQAIEKETTYEVYEDVYQLYADKDMTADGDLYLQAALELNADTAQDHYQRGRIYYFMGDQDNASEELITAANDGYGDALLFLGQLYLDAGNPEDAQTIYQQYLSTQDNVAAGYNGLALCEIEMGEYEAALHAIETGLETADGQTKQSLLFNEIVAYESERDFATALAKTEEFLETYPTNEAAQKEYEFLKYR